MSHSPIYVYCVLGGPGSGKSTISKAISKIYAFKLIKIGDMIEKFCKNKKLPLDESTREIIHDCQSNGTLIPDFNVVILVHSALIWEKSVNRIFNFVLDGFPRTKMQLESFIINGHDIVIEAIIFLSAPDKVMWERYSNRRKDKKSDDKLFETKVNAFKEFTLPIKDMVKPPIVCLNINTEDTVSVNLRFITDKLKLNVKN